MHPGRDVSLRDDAAHLPVAVDNGKPPHFPLGHSGNGLADVVVLATGHHIRRHHLFDRSVFDRSSTGQPLHDNVAIGHHADEPLRRQLQDGDGPNVFGFHDLRNTNDRIRRLTAGGVRRHHFTTHGHRPPPRKVQVWTGCKHMAMPGPRTSQALFSSRFRIFPVAPIGSESLNSIMRGYLYEANCSRHQSTSTSSVTVAPGLRTMKALTSSPMRGSGTPITAASDTAGWVSSTSSSSRG